MVERMSPSTGSAREKVAMRVCSICRTEKPNTDFHAEPRVKDGLAAACRACIKEIRKGRHTPGNGGYCSPEQERARGRVRDAVRHGKIIKPMCCQQCGAETPAHLLDGHHEDYSKPLDVIWLCRSCHGLRADGGVEGHAEGPQDRSCAREPEAGNTASSGQAIKAGVEPGPSDALNLLSCPFCCGKPYLQEREGQRPDESTYSIHCDNCEATHEGDRAVVIASWNKRVTLSDVGAQKPGASAELSRDSDIGILLSVLRNFEDAVGEDIDDTEGVVAQIEADYLARVVMSQEGDPVRSSTAKTVDAHAPTVQPINAGTIDNILSKLDQGAAYQGYPEGFGFSWTGLCRDAATIIRRLRASALLSTDRKGASSWRDSWEKLLRPEDWIICNECAGKGDIETVYPFPDDPYFCAVNKCEACNGKGGHPRDTTSTVSSKPSCEA